MQGKHEKSVKYILKNFVLIWLSKLIGYYIEVI